MIDLSRFRAVIFDFDGVIVDSETLQARAWTRVGRELGLGDCRIPVEQIAGRVDIELAPLLFPGHDPRRCVQRKWQIEAEMEAAGELRLVPGVDRFVRSLARTHRLAICSSCDVRQLRRRLEYVGLSSLFSVVVGRSDGVAHKPAPELYLRALAELGVGAGQACAIEDSETGVAAARAAGVYVIQLVHSGQPHAALADEWIASFE
ncbi:HAD family hydrolase [Fontivita pretiosa]|uniref:HAD family hydrolase n=1 Tax=Fontivita pretiosa TaxID=2989684 RepID=UPI003D168224